ESALSIAEPSLAAMVENLHRQNEAVVRGSVINTPAAAASSARKQSEVMQEELNTLRLRYNENHPEVRSLVVAIERLKAIEQKQSVASSSALANASATPEMAEKVLRERERLANLRAQIAVTQKEIESRQA